jgi:hypothetical protein
MKAVLAVFVALSAVTALDARQSGVAGTWELVVQGPASHGDMTATLELQQDGSTVKGTLAAHGNTHTLDGKFVDGELTIDTTDTPAGQGISLTARLKDDGTLAGYLSSPHGDRQWTASRTRAQK